MRTLLLALPLLALACSEPLEPELPPLAVTGTVPVQQARGVADTAAVTLMFNRKVNADDAQVSFSPALMYPNLANNSIYLGSGAKSLTVAYYEHEHLLPGTTYTVTFTGIEGADGGMLAPYNLVFETR